MRRTIALVLVTLCLSMPWGSPGLAHSNGAACGTGPGQTWTGSAECHFKISGSPLTIYATASAPAGEEARVHIRLTTDQEEGGPAVVIAECKDGPKPESASCEVQIGPDPQVRLPGNLSTDGTCIVEGAVEGTYWCQSGLGF